MATTIKSEVDIIKQRINKDVAVFLSENNNYGIDDLLLVAATPAVRLSIKNTNPMDLNRIMLSISKFVKRFPRYQNLTKDAVKKGLEEEWIKNFDDETKYEMLSELSVISGFDDNGLAIKDNKMYNVFLKCNFAPLKYGNQLYEFAQTKKRTAKAKISNIDPDLNLAPKLAPYLAWYKKYWEKFVEWESYKWDAVKQFQSTFDIQAPDLAENLKLALSKEVNLLSGQRVFAKDTLLKNARFSPEEVRSALAMLFDESIDIVKRIDDFTSQFRAIHEENKRKGYLRENEQPGQDPHAISVYLAFALPNLYYIYKEGIWYDFFYETEIDYPSLYSFTHKLVGYNVICNHIREVLIADEELMKLSKASYSDDPTDYHMLTQDFIYAIGRYFVDFSKVPLVEGK